MPISLQSGVLDKHMTFHAQGTIDAWVTYTLSNGFTDPLHYHGGIPASGVQVIATAAGRDHIVPADIAAWIQANVPDMHDIPITVASPPT